MRNASKKARDFALRLRRRAKVLQCFRSRPSRCRAAARRSPFKPKTPIVLTGMKAGEYALGGVRHGLVQGGERDTTLPVDFARGRGRQGHQRLPLRHDAGVGEPGAARAAALRRRGDGAPRPGVQARKRTEVAKAARKLAKTKSIRHSAYLKFLAKTRDATGKTVDGFLATKSHDRGLGVLASWQALGSAMDAKDFGNAFANHTTLLNKLDVATTLAQKAKKKKKT